MVEANPTPQFTQVLVNTPTPQGEELFAPTKIISITVAQEFYDKTREISGYSTFKDLPAVNNDVAVWNEGVRKLGVIESDMINLKDQSRGELRELFRDLTHQLVGNKKNGEKTLVMFLLASHCIMRNTSFVVCNAKKPGDVYFNIESSLRSLGQIDNTFVFTVLAACRSAETQVMKNAL